MFSLGSKDDKSNNPSGQEEAAPGKLCTVADLPSNAGHDLTGEVISFWSSGVVELYGNRWNGPRGYPNLFNTGGRWRVQRQRGARSA